MTDKQARDIVTALNNVTLILSAIFFIMILLLMILVIKS